MSKVAEVALGENRLVVNTKDLVFDAVEAIVEGYADVKKSHSAFAQYPMQEGESMEDWSERAFKAMQDEAKREDGEKVEDYLKRIYSLSTDKHKLVFDTIEMLAKVFKQDGKVTKESCKKANYPEAKAFVVAVFRAADLSTRDFE